MSRKADRRGIPLRIRPFPQSRCDAIVVAQLPAPHTLIAGPRAAHTVVKLRLRG